MDVCLIAFIIVSLSATPANGGKNNKRIDERYEFRLSTNINFTDGNRKNLFIRDEKLTLYCRLYENSGDFMWGRGLLVVQYKLQGRAPTVTFFNQTWSTHFNYSVIKRKNMDRQDKIEIKIRHWKKEISQEFFTFGGTEALAKEPWRVTVSMDVGNVIYRSNFTLLDVTTEPLMRPTLSPRTLKRSPITRDVEDIVIAQSPCAPNVAVVSLKRPPSADIYIGLTLEAFALESIEWFVLAASTLCSEAGQNCSSLKVLDIALTNYRILILTDHGLFYSNETHKAEPRSVLAFNVMWKSAACDIIESGKLTFSGICQGRHNDVFREDVGCVAYQCVNKETFGAFSVKNVTSWIPVKGVENNATLSSIAHNYHTDTLNMLYARQSGGAVLKVIQLKHGVIGNYTFPPFEFPVEAAITGLTIHPISCLYYAYGKQLWLSEDGGNWFDMIYNPRGETINKVAIGLTDGIIVAQQANQSTEFLFSKAGVTRVAPFSVTGVSRCTVFIDSFSHIYCLVTNQELTAVKLDVNRLIKEYKARSDHPLAIQMFSQLDVTFYEFAKNTAAESFFYNSHIGKQISQRGGESAIIKHVNFAPDCAGFLACVDVKLVQPYHLEHPSDTSALVCTIEVVGHDNREAMLKLSNESGGPCQGGWHESDVYKTVLIPKHGSFLITQFQDIVKVKALAIFPIRRQSNIKRNQPFWHLIDFGIDQRTGKSVWYLGESDCHYELEVEETYGHRTLFELDIDERISLSNFVSVAEPVVGHLETMLYVTLSNPWHFHTESHIDTRPLPAYTQNLSFSLHSIIKVKGMTVVRVHLPMASLLCPHTSRLLTVFTGCPALKRLVYREPIQISREDFLHGNPLDADTNSPLLQTLPPNYRPPSTEGVSIPLTSNIYNADPSIPRPSNIILRSQESGRYKQCAGKSDRQDCECTDVMRYSPFVRDSDCRERVFKLCFPGELKPELLVLQLGRQERKLDQDVPVSVFEINGRDVKFTSKPSLMLKVITAYRGRSDHEAVYYSHETLKIGMEGTELYHFRLWVLEGCSHCNLEIEFQVYVHSAPLAYPWQYIVNFSVTLLLGLVFAGSYLYYLAKTDGLVHFRPLTDRPQKGFYPPWKLAQALKEKEKAESADAN